jgi:hypothetical protein
VFIAKSNASYLPSEPPGAGKLMIVNFDNLLNYYLFKNFELV